MKTIQELLEYTKPLRLLYVEDSKSTREMFMMIFEPLFKSVLVASDGKKGLNLFKKSGADIVITDIEMPIMDGLKMSKLIKELDFDIPIILTTGNMENSLFIESIEIGIEAYLPKPIDMKLLNNTLSRVCKIVGAKKSLKEQSQYFKILTESSIVSKSDISGTITYVNDNLCRISGYTRDELLGQNHSLFRYPANSDKMYKKMWDTILSGRVWNGRIENLNKNGGSFLSDTIIIPLTDFQGHIKEFIAIRQDITEYVMMKRSLQEEAYKKDEERQITEAKEAFLILFTHELKTPLNAIINFAKYLKGKSEDSEDVEPKKVQKLLHSILTNAKEMLANINNILGISKLKSGKLNYSKQFFSLNKIIDDILQQFDSLIIEKNIKVEPLINDDFNIYSDEFRVKQVIINIISNAIKYGKDKIKIEVIESNTKIELYIDDNGPGIKDKRKVFELYEQAGSSILNHGNNGTGVGLYFVKLLCDDLNIDYRLEDSKSLSGTRFTFSFKNR